MKNEQELLDPSELHILSEQECELISVFRVLNKTQRKEIFKLVFTTALNDERIK